MRTVCLLLIFCMGFGNSLVYAGNCFNKICVPHHNVQQVAIVDHVDVLQKRVEFDAEYFLGYDGYYDVVNELQAQDYAKDKDIILKQAEQVDKLISLLEQTLRGSVTISDSEPQPQPTTNNTTPTTQETPPSDNTTETYNDDDLNVRVFDIFEESCVSCHSPTSPKAGLVLTGEENGESWLNNLDLEDRVLVYDHVAGINLAERGKKLMPLGGPPLSDSEVEVLRLWMISKAEEIKRGKKDE